MDTRIRLAVRAASQLALAVSLGCASDVVADDQPEEGGDGGGRASAEDPETFCGRIKVARDFIPDCDRKFAVVSCVTTLEGGRERGCRAKAELFVARCWVQCDYGSSDPICGGAFRDFQECMGYDPDA